MHESSNVVWITERELEHIEREANGAYPRETGGVLLGYSANGSFVVTDIIGPGPRAVHRLWHFKPDAAYHEAEVARVYLSSGRMHTYLGDWHTHPDGIARMSFTDGRTLRRIARTRAARVNNPIMLISAGSPTNGWENSAWRFLDESFWKIHTEDMKIIPYLSTR
jgi:integrative and conjugative element protein (TIGR02256 family)